MDPDPYHPLADDNNEVYKGKNSSPSELSKTKMYIAIAGGLALAAGLYFGFPYLLKIDQFLEKETPGVETLSDKIRDTVGTVDSSD